MKKLILLLALAACLLASCGSTDTPDTLPETEEEINVDYITVQNPVAPSGADPWVIEHEGQYYYCFSGSTSGTGGVRVAKVTSPYALPSITNPPEDSYAQVYTAPEGTAYTHEYWAPELHYLDGAWYIYVAADNGDNNNHRMYVLKGTTQDPTDPFEMVGQITDESNKWAIDGTVVMIGGEMYFVWSGWEGDENVAQNIYIAHMSDPCTVDSERTLLSAPEHFWEQSGLPHVNEGPAALYNGDRVFVAYSASGSWTDDYCIGLLTYNGGDPLDAASWEKAERPVFKKVDGLVYGPGHCSFTTAVDGSIWMVCHANPNAGSGWQGRTAWIAPIYFDIDGTPIFGQPQAEVLFPVISE